MKATTEPVAQGRSEGSPERLSRRLPRRLVVYLDRDGTIVDDPGYLRDPSKLVLLPGAARAIARLNARGATVVLVTNQSGIARGLMTVDDVAAVHAELARQLAESSARLDHVELCPHLPERLLPAGERPCDCRKPRPAMVQRARSALGLEGTAEYVVGDKEADLGLARATGCRSVLVRTGEGRATEATLRSEGRLSDLADTVVDDLAAAVDWILSDHGESS